MTQGSRVLRSADNFASDLLQVRTLEAANTTTRPPLMMEFPADPATSPFLVTSSNSLLWVSPRKPLIRAAFRPLNQNALFWDVIQSVYKMGIEMEWGNVQPLTGLGLLNAAQHLRSYGLPNPEYLMNPKTKIDKAPIVEKDGEEPTLLTLNVVYVDWLPENVVVVAPQDRSFVGFALMSSPEHGLAIVHNASRGLAVCGTMSL